MAIKSYSIHFERADKLSPRVNHFVFKASNEALTQFTPGQFVTLLLEHEGKVVRRSYSLANQSPNGKVEFAASFVPGGIASELLFNLEPGTEITAQGPFGRLILNEQDNGKRLVLVGTSTGITPYLAMLEQLSEKLNKNELSEVVIIQGVTHQEELLYADTFNAFADKHENAHFFAALSQEKAAIEGYKNYITGRAQVVLKTLQLSPDNDVIYLCGNPQMIDNVFSDLKEQGFDAKQIRREKYISR